MVKAFLTPDGSVLDINFEITEINTTEGLTLEQHTHFSLPKTGFFSVLFVMHLNKFARLATNSFAWR